jgi:hypothetical protein
VQLIQPESEARPTLRAHRRKGMGESHKHETDHNPAGVWTIDRIPERLAGRFIAVLKDVGA